ncbi:MAG: DNA recombination protein RmuC [Hyphomicrobiales bacterium]|nr:DNA recombination protein RmuC [Hyphomicrobiales bacterium]MBV8826726.1 DNA recombination protein RmuC [Hyphomicrobiales bacterium]MBV9429201.1 DNA recombination protein RmuC [Bradyrhizobiaceae bacterium]
MGTTLFVLGGVRIGPAEILSALGLAVMVVLAIVLMRAFRRQGGETARHAQRAADLETRLAEMVRVQADTAGRVHMMGETLSGRQAELARLVGERLDAVTHRLGQSMTESGRHTMESLRHLHERLAVIDHAQKNLTDLASQVTSLREVLANKQMRGAFGQGRMETIVRDGLPRGSFEFQFTLTNKTRPDCVVFLPGDDRPIVIDAKFPLEAVSALREAKSEEARKQAAQRVRQDVSRHVNDIADRYLIPGETQDIALMFVPSESVYAELYDGFDDIIQKAYRAQVVLVSPSLLMLAIQVMQQILKDARMREAAGQIRTEVGHLMGDVGRLRERVLKLQQHFGQASEDVTQVLISADKIAKRGGRIEALEFDGEDAPREARVVMAPLGLKLEAGE